MNDLDNLIQALIMEELKRHPEGMTEKQITKVVNKKLKKVKKMLDILNNLWYNDNVIRKEKPMQKNVIVVAFDKQTQQIVAWTHSLRKLEEWEIDLQ